MVIVCRSPAPRLPTPGESRQLGICINERLILKSLARTCCRPDNTFAFEAPANTRGLGLIGGNRMSARSILYAGLGYSQEIHFPATVA